MLEASEGGLELVEGSELTGGEEFALNHGEVDFDLIEPTGVDGRVDEDEVGPFGAQTLAGGGSAMGRAVIDDPEDAVCGAVGLLGHDIGHEPVEGHDASLAFASAEQLGAMNI